MSEPATLEEMAEWLEASASNSRKNFPHFYTEEFRRGYECAVGWVRRFADRV